MTGAGYESQQNPHSERGRPAEDVLRDAAYTAVGLGIVAYKYTEPRLRKAADAACKWRDQNSDEKGIAFEKKLRDLGDAFAPVAEKVMPIRSWAARMTAEGPHDRRK